MPLKIMKHNIKVDKTAVYHSLGNVKTAKTIWFVLHGYGMLAKYFVKKFDPIANNTNCIIAPEGLSKFYVSGFDGRVGAAWMTKEGREEEIVDYINYLNQLYHIIIKENNTSGVKINIVGFSQGGATACRWVANRKIQVDNFILWSSVFPDDMDFNTFGNEFNTYILCGDRDEFATSDRTKKQEEVLGKSGLDYKFIEFKGTHDIPKEVLINQTEKNNW